MTYSNRHYKSVKYKWKLNNKRVAFAFRYDVVKTPSDAYSAEGFSIGDEFLIGESDVADDGSVRVWTGQGSYAFLKKDEIKLKQMMRTTTFTEVIEDKEQIDRFIKSKK